MKGESGLKKGDVRKDLDGPFELNLGLKQIGGRYVESLLTKEKGLRLWRKRGEKG